MTADIEGTASPGKIPIRLGYADTALGQVHYRQAGAGRPVVLLPNASHSHHHLARLQHHLATSHQVTIFDLLGSGYSVPLPPTVEISSLAVALKFSDDSVIFVVDTTCSGNAHRIRQLLKQRPHVDYGRGI